MFSKGKAAQALEEKREAFGRALETDYAALEIYLQALDSVVSLDAPTRAGWIEDHLGGVAWPGARPMDGLATSGFVAPFNHEWANAAEARSWALKKLRGVTTVAVDGSQIAASKEFAVPCSLVQAAWFVNPHDPAKPYTKDVRDEVLTSNDHPEQIEEIAFDESHLNRARFSLEMQVAAEQIVMLRGMDPVPVVFIDGTFVLSFAARMLPNTRAGYLNALFDLLDAAARERVPVVGYVDRSYASDLTVMLRTAFDLAPAGLFDAQLLLERMGMLDRTAVFRCARGDILPEYRTPERDRSQDVCFLYLKAGSDRLPSRLDVPSWVVDEGLIDHVVDIVRAEIIVGTGYPYALQAADATAVLTAQDRMAFYRLWQDFSENAGLPQALPGKTLSKAQRR